MSLSRTLGICALLSILSCATLGAHCQVPCGIYDDAARIAQIREDIETIEKAVNNIIGLNEKTDALSRNQLIRWVNTKEDHASRIIDVVSLYFLTQKIKPATADSRDAYLQMLADHHAVMRAAMKAKQTVDPAVVSDLKAAVDKIAKYWAPAEHRHEEPQTRRR